MSKIVSKKAPEFTEGIYDLKLVKTEDVTSNFGGESKDQIKFTFEPAEDIGEGIESVVAYAGLSFWEGSDTLEPAKLYLFSKVFKVEPVEDEMGDLEIDFAPVFGSVVSGLVEKNRKGWPTLKKIYKLKHDARADNAKLAEAEAAVTAGLVGDKSEEVPVEA